MSHSDPITDQLLNAFIDNQLDAADRARVLQAIQTNPELATRLAQLQQVNALLTFAYQHPPASPHTPFTGVASRGTRTRQSIAAGFVLLAGMGIGWWLHSSAVSPSVPLTNLAQLNVQHPGNNKILIHINNMDQQKIDYALAEAEQLLASANQQGKDLQVEILANADGLGVFRVHSPYAQRIEHLANQHDNVSFRACGFAIQHARLIEGHDIKLLPEAKPVDAALEEIIRKLKLGWLYVRA